MRIDLGTKTGKKVTVFILSIILLVAFAGCTGKDQTITTPDGNVKISQGSGSGPSWCKAGTKITSTGASGQGSFEIKGIVNFEGKEVCLSEVTTGEGTVEQYFNEDSSYMVIISKDKSGKEISRQELSQPK